jgi:hypothetical protein
VVGVVFFAKFIAEHSKVFLIFCQISLAASKREMDEEVVEKKEIYTYQAPWMIYGMNWSHREDIKLRLAIGSFIEQYNNKVEFDC